MISEQNLRVNTGLYNFETLYREGWPPHDDDEQSCWRQSSVFMSLETTCKVSFSQWNKYELHKRRSQHVV